MALFDSVVEREHFEARAKVSGAPNLRGKISFSLNAAPDGSPGSGGGVFVYLSPWDAECLARVLLNAAGERRSEDETI